MKKPPRPPKKQDEAAKFKKAVTVRYNDDQHELLSHVALSRGLDLANWLRMISVDEARRWMHTDEAGRAAGTTIEGRATVLGTGPKLEGTTSEWQRDRDDHPASTTTRGGPKPRR